MQEQGKEAMEGSTSARRVAIVHPDLGLGGAERLVVDAALGLQERGHKVVIYTAYRDVQRCFPEVRPRHLGGNVSCTVVNTYVPRNVFGMFHALCTVVQCVLLALYVCLNASHVDVAICDIVSAPALIFRMFGVPCIFYCHFPDQMLADSIRVSRTNSINVDYSAGQVLKRLVLRLYRECVDRLERFAIARASCVAVNSEFTAEMFDTVYPNLLKQHGLPEPRIVYPAVKVPPRSRLPTGLSEKRLNEFMAARFPSVQHPIMLLSLNRFERKKNVALAIRTLHLLRTSHMLVSDEEIRNSIVLTVAGGYDDRLEENKQNLLELKDLTDKLGLQQSVAFELNFDDAQRTIMLRNARVLLYTPSAEHFGIVPLEAMALQVPVIAVDSGGPCETVERNVTGFLCKPEAEAFAEATARLVMDPELAAKLGRRGRSRVEQKFSITALGSALEDLMLQCCERQTRQAMKHKRTK